jgi:predicted metal-dependent hydrolase
MQIKKIIRSKRKTIALQVCDDATLIVRAPFRVDYDVIEKVILKHHKWLENKKKEILSRDVRFTQRQFVSGESYLYLGKFYRLKVVQTNKLAEPLSLKNGYFYLQKNVVNGRKAFISWYKRAAYEKMSQRVNWYANKRGFKYNQVKIGNAQKQWGSCTHLGNLNFPWRLVLAPLPVVDYVVVHELVHLIEKNHSKSFWNKVRILIPDYKKQKNWLRKNEYLLRL